MGSNYVHTFYITDKAFEPIDTLNYGHNLLKNRTSIETLSVAKGLSFLAIPIYIQNILRLRIRSQICRERLLFFVFIRKYAYKDISSMGVLPKSDYFHSSHIEK